MCEVEAEVFKIRNAVFDNADKNLHCDKSILKHEILSYKYSSHYLINTET